MYCLIILVCINGYKKMQGDSTTNTHYKLRRDLCYGPHSRRKPFPKKHIISNAIPNSRVTCREAGGRLGVRVWWAKPTNGRRHRITIPAVRGDIRHLALWAPEECL